ncbi:SDR family oxidoreductase [Parvularcula bermudensis]|uniref:SDR family oxidoreductase n=1 Tax=Parvularcula bermudensis TaxID=208216 RepID=UPI0003210603|nr:SDR family oxidoreductase [Parvularcula bermudensis]
MPHVLITGANRGIGLALAAFYTKQGWTVTGTARQPEQATALKELAGAVHQLDVRDREAISRLATQIEAPIDILISNAGVSGPARERQVFGALDYEGWMDTLLVNTIGSVAVCEAFTPHVAASNLKKMAVITSRMGSIDDTSCDVIAYRTSKTALNMAMVAASKPLKERGIAVGVLHPGWVDTRMGGGNAPLSTEKSAQGLAEQIDGLAPTEKAPFLAYDGRVLPW